MSQLRIRIALTMAMFAFAPVCAWGQYALPNLTIRARENIAPENIPRPSRLPSTELPNEQVDQAAEPMVPQAVVLRPNTMPLTLYQAVTWSLLNDRLVRSLDGAVNIQNVTTYDAHIAAQQIYGAAAQFDPKISSRIINSRIDQPADAFFGPGIVTNNRRDELDFALRLEKAWSTGATTSVGYEPPLAYLFFPGGVSSGFNPLHSSDLVFRARQPLLRGAGQNANLAKFRIAEQLTGQAELTVTAAVQGQIRSVEEAYWRLHAARVRLEAVEFAIPLAEKNVEIERTRFGAERSTYSEVARASVKLEELRQQQIAALYAVRQRDYQLRQLVGIPVNQGDLLMPADSPVSAPPSLRFEEFVNTAILRRPDLQRRRLEVAIRQNNLLLAQNSKLPELDAQGLYRASGISDDFNKAFTQMGSFDFADWNLGLTFSVPIGNRFAKSQVKAAELSAVRETAILRGFEQQVGFEIADRMARVEADFARFERAMQQVQHSQQWLKLARIRYEEPPLQRRGQDSLLLALFDYQSAIQAHIEALSAAADSLADYNTGLARLEEARGTILDRWAIVPGHQVVPSTNATPQENQAAHVANRAPQVPPNHSPAASTARAPQMGMPAGPMNRAGNRFPAASPSNDDFQPSFNRPSVLPQ